MDTVASIKCNKCGCVSENIHCDVVNFGTPLPDDYCESDSHYAEIDEILWRGKALFATHPDAVMECQDMTSLKILDAMEYVRLLVYTRLH